MKGFVTAAAVAALANGVSAHGHGHAHELFHRRNAPMGENCGCTTTWTTFLGPPTLVQPKPVKTSTEVVPVPPTSTSVEVPVTTTAVPVTTVHVPIPTPDVTTCPTPGTYTFPATTITVSETTTVCGATSTTVPAGTHTVGGVTTVVETATTVTCPVATVQTSGTVTTSTIVQTTYVCPSSGTYVIAPTTTVCPSDTTITYVVPTTICPGTYTRPEQVITVTETDYVTFCPYTSSGVPTTSAVPSTSAAPPPSKPTTTVAPPPVYSKPTTHAYTKPSSSAKPKPTGGNQGGLGGGSGDHWGITYTPYNEDNGECKSASEVSKDIAKLKQGGFEIVRVYSTDCNTLENVGNACKANGMDMIIGIFVKETGCSTSCPDIKEQIDTISSWAQWDMTKLMVIGNEAIMNGYCTASELVELIEATKSACPGYKGAYTISETLNIWQQSDVSGALCDVIDITGANIHPYFNAEVTPETAGQFVKGQLDILSEICPGKKGLNLECGWPTAGKCNGSACPGEKEQHIAIQSIRETCGNDVIFFTPSNDNWKASGACECEKSWGCSAAFGL